MSVPLLAVSDLRCGYGASSPVLHGIDLHLHAGQSLGIAGESGSGKSHLALALAGLLPEGCTASGALQWQQQTLPWTTAHHHHPAWRGVRGTQIGLVLQDAMGCLNPYRSIGAQMTEGLRQHRHLGHGEAKAEGLRWLDALQLPNAAALWGQSPLACSGGMRQRIALAQALALQPKLLIADEPSSALDASLQRALLRLLRGLCQQHGMALILISHDLPLLAEGTDEVMVLYAGHALELGPTAAVLQTPQHPYTQALLHCRPGPPHPPRTRLPTIAAAEGHWDATACAFAPRCPVADATCQTAPPFTSRDGIAQRLACWRPLVRCASSV